MTTARLAKISGNDTPSRTVNPARRFLRGRSKGIGSAGSGNSSNVSFSPPSEIATRSSSESASDGGSSGPAIGL